MSKPLIIMCAFPASGHIEPLLQITAYLVSKGFQVFFLCGSPFEQRARDAGAEPWPNDFGPLTPETIRGQFAFPEGHLRWNYQQKHIFLDGALARHSILKECLESVRMRFPNRQVILFNEILFLGALPYLLGASLPKGYEGENKLKVINFHTTIDWTGGDEVAPYGLALPPPKGEEDRTRYRQLYDEMRPAAKETMEYANRMMRSLGATKDLSGDFFFSAVTLLPDVVIMACSPSLEYPRNTRDHLPTKIKYIGGLPLKTCSKVVDTFPPWWDEVKDNARLPSSDSSRRKVIFVSQGTANIDDYSELVIPTIAALGAREDVIVVATLGKRAARLPDSVAIPGNTKVVDYLPYDAILSMADVFAFNGGYGGFMHGVMNGVPMIFAGTAADKGEVAARAEWAGIAVNLRTNTPTKVMILDAVERVLDDGRMKARAMELRQENEAMDSLGEIERQILELSEARLAQE